MTSKTRKNNCNRHIAQYLNKLRQSDDEIWSVNRIEHEKHFSYNITKYFTKCWGETIPRPFSKKSKKSISHDQ